MRAARDPLCPLGHPGSWIRGVLQAAPLLLAAGVLALVPGMLAWGEEEPPLPEGILVNQGLPPLLPRDLHDPEAVRDAAARLTTYGRLHAGTRRGGDALFSAAHLHRNELREAATALALFAEAAGAYPPSDPTVGVVLVRHGAAELSRGHVPAARRLFEAALAWIDAEAPVGLSESEAFRWTTLRHVASYEFRPLVAELHAHEGMFRIAAETYERMLVDRALTLSRATRGRYEQRIATFRLKLGQTEAALRAIDDAIEHADEPRTRANRRFWRLHARHGLIADDGGPRLPGTWPGAAYEQDMRAFLRAIDGVAGMGTTYLALGSSAYAAGRMETALEIYLIALRDPELLAAARGEPALARGLLVGYAAALELERYDDAEALLGAVVRISDDPIEEADAMRIAIAEGRARVEGRGAPPDESPSAQSVPRAARDEVPPLDEHPAGIRPASHPATHPATAPPPTGPPAHDATDPGRTLQLVLGGLGLLLLGLWAWTRRRA